MLKEIKLDEDAFLKWVNAYHTWELRRGEFHIRYLSKFESEFINATIVATEEACKAQTT